MQKIIGIPSFILPLCLLFSVAVQGQDVSGKRHLLRYDEPARIWEEALPLGNGQTGAMVFGGTEEELYQLNDHTLWSGGPEPGNNPGAKAYLPVIRQQIFDKKYAATEETWRNMEGPYSARFLPLGNLKLNFGAARAVDYRRTLDLDSALVTISYKSEGTKFRRTTFLSHPDRVMVIRISADQKGKINLRAKLNSPLRHETSAHRQGLVMKGQAPVYVAAREYFPDQIQYDDEKSMEFEVHLRVENKGGEVYAQDSILKIEAADEVTFFLAEATDFSGFDRLPGARGEKADEIAVQALYAAMNKGYDRLLDAHLTDYRSLFDRVTLDLRGGGDYSRMPVNERLKYFGEHQNDFDLQRLYYQFGRYLLISSSRPGSRPANLQGIWNRHVQPPWGSNYTININTEMNYWPAENTNLAECHRPLLDFISELAVNGTKTARENYGIEEGWVAHHNSDLWAKTSPVGNYGRDKSYYPQAFAWQMGGAWLSTHLWEHFLYHRDTLFLKEQAYPLMKGAAQFLMHWLVKDPESGLLVTAPSTSPENLFGAESGKYAIGKGTAMDMAIIREVFSQVIRAAEILKTDAVFRTAVKEKLDATVPYKIGRYGQIQEWFDDLDDPDDHHRHISHLYGLFPGKEIDTHRSPELAKAARITLEHRGDAGTGWSMAWKINWWARLGDGARAYRLLQKAFQYINPADTETKSTGGGTYPNLFDAHPPFQIDGNFGVTAGITEMLMQSHNEWIDILPALPPDWQNGTVKGIRARGNFEVAISWEKGKVDEVKIQSLSGGPCVVKSKIPLRLAEPESVVTTREGDLLRFETGKGTEYILTSRTE